MAPTVSAGLVAPPCHRESVSAIRILFLHSLKGIRNKKKLGPNFTHCSICSLWINVSISLIWKPGVIDSSGVCVCMQMYVCVRGYLCTHVWSWTPQCRHIGLEVRKFEASLGSAANRVLDLLFKSLLHRRCRILYP